MEKKWLANKVQMKYIAINNLINENCVLVENMLSFTSIPFGQIKPLCCKLKYDLNLYQWLLHDNDEIKIISIQWQI